MCFFFNSPAVVQRTTSGADTTNSSNFVVVGAEWRALDIESKYNSLILAHGSAVFFVITVCASLLVLPSSSVPTSLSFQSSCLQMQERKGADTHIQINERQFVGQSELLQSCKKWAISLLFTYFGQVNRYKNSLLVVLGAQGIAVDPQTVF